MWNIVVNICENVDIIVYSTTPFKFCLLMDHKTPIYKLRKLIISYILAQVAENNNNESGFSIRCYLHLGKSFKLYSCTTTYTTLWCTQVYSKTKNRTVSSLQHNGTEITCYCIVIKRPGYKN